MYDTHTNTHTHTHTDQPHEAVHRAGGSREGGRDLDQGGWRNCSNPKLNQRIDFLAEVVPQPGIASRLSLQVGDKNWVGKAAF